MNKNLIKNLLICLIACFSIEMSAQVAGVRCNNVANPKYGIEAGENQAWWGYFDGSMDNIWNIGYGQDESTDGCLYNAAIFVPNNELTNEKSIKVVRVLLNSVANISDIYVWASESLPDVPENAEYSQKLNKADLTDKISGNPINDIVLNTPVKIGENGIYVGYSFRMNTCVTEEDYYPILYQKSGKTCPGRMIIRWFNGEWVDLSEDATFGNLCMNVLLEGDFAKNSLSADSEFRFTVGALGLESALNLKVENTGTSAVNNISYVFTVNGKASEETTYTFSKPISLIGENRVVELPVVMNGDLGFGKGEINITKVNGNANESANTKSAGDIALVSKKVPASVLYEEYSTVSSGYYPMAIVAKKNAKSKFGEGVICVSNHVYDKMSVQNIAEISVREYKHKNWYEKCDINRVFINADPYYGTTPSDIRQGAVPLTCTVLDDIEYIYNQTPLAEVKVSGSYDKDQNIVTVNGAFTFLCDINDAAYNVLYYVLEDGMTGSGSGWEMENFLSGVEGLEVLDPGFEEFVVAPEGKMQNIIFDDVAVAEKGFPYGLDDVIGNSVENGKVINNTVSFDFNELQANYKNPEIQDFNKLKVVAVLLDRNTGRVVNAAQSALSSELGIDGVTTSEDKVAVAFYSLDGTLRNNLEKGINIVKYSDGSVKKVIIK